MGVADHAGNARWALETAASTSSWLESGTREMTLPSLGLWTSRNERSVPTKEPPTKFRTSGYFNLPPGSRMPRLPNYLKLCIGGHLSHYAKMRLGQKRRKLKRGADHILLLRRG